jgi:hypothetical protein
MVLATTTQPPTPAPSDTFAKFDLDVQGDDRGVGPTTPVRGCDTSDTGHYRGRHQMSGTLMAL